jgi:hypothetical protein
VKFFVALIGAFDMMTGKTKKGTVGSLILSNVLRFPRSSIDYFPSGLVILLEIISLIGVGYCGLFREVVIEIIRFQPISSLFEKKSNHNPTLLKSHPDRRIRRILVWILLTIFALKWIEILIHSIVFLSETTSHSSSSSDSSLNNSIKSNIYLNTFPLECVFALIIEKRYYYILKTILRTLPRFFSLIAQFTLLICVFTGILLILINHDTYGADTHYSTYSDALWTNINVMNGANWPTPFVDLYKVTISSQSILILSHSFSLAITILGFLLCVLCRCGKLGNVELYHRLDAWILQVSSLPLHLRRIFADENIRTLRNETQIITQTRSLMMLAQAYEALKGQQQHPISLDSFRSLLRELTGRYSCIKGFTSPNPSPLKRCLNQMRGVDAQVDYEEDLDILLGVFNFHFRRVQMKGTTEMLDDPWSAAVIQTPFRPALDWIEEYCTDLPLLNCDILVKLQRKSLLPVPMDRSGLGHFSLLSFPLLDPCFSCRLSAIKDLSSSGIPIDLFFQFFASLITKQDVPLWGHAIGVLCEEFHLKEVTREGDVSDKDDSIAEREKEEKEEKEESPIYDTQSSRYLNLLMARYEKNPNRVPRNQYFDDNIRLQWRASRYEYFQSSSSPSSPSSNKRISLEERFISIRIFSSIVNSQVTQFTIDSLVCLICLLIVAGVDSHGIRIFLLTIAFLESVTRYMGKSFKR